MTRVHAHHTPPQQGFTLIELMITVAIIAILAKVGLGAYQDSVLKGKRAQGRTALIELMQQQERYMTQRNCYLSFTSSAPGSTSVTSADYSGSRCGGAPSFTSTAPFPFKNFAGDNAATASYLLSSAQCSATLTIDLCVQVAATPVSADPAVGTLQMTSTGVKSCTGSAASSNFKLCWP